jgi:hypothetical protein
MADPVVELLLSDVGVQGETGQPVPAGGLSGQILTKASNANGDMKWDDAVEGMGWQRMAQRERHLRGCQRRHHDWCAYHGQPASGEVQRNHRQWQ